jgi:hypothetical protein
MPNGINFFVVPAESIDQLHWRRTLVQNIFIQLLSKRLIDVIFKYIAPPGLNELL